MDIKTIETYFDDLAEKYHDQRMGAKKLFNESIEMPATLSLAKTYSRGRVLDVGCGTGIYSKILKKEFDMDVTAIDVSANMLKIAKDFCAGLGIDFFKCDFHGFEPNNKFDLVLGSFFLGYEDSLSLTFGRTKALLSDDGGVIFSMVHPVRMSLDEHNYNSYKISDYFGGEKHKVIIVPNEEPLFQPKRTFEQVINAAKESGFLLKSLLEPSPKYELGDERRFKFYSRLPTVSVFEFVKDKEAI